MAGEPLRLIDEACAFRLATPGLCFQAVRAALAAAAGGDGWNNPVVIAPGLQPGESFSLKSGGARAARLAGAKLGAFWPGAAGHGLPRHSSVVLLLDPDTGRAAFVLEAGPMNGRRTAAADAVASDLLARPDSRVLSVIGAGAQAAYEVEALARIRSFQRICIASRTADAAERLAAGLRGRGLPAEAHETRAACEAADVLVTATPSRAALFETEWISPGTHVSAMGADQKGKQELPVELLRRANLFADWPAQSLEIGEFQRLGDAAGAAVRRPAAIGDVILGRAPGRTSAEEITVFDSSGLALQDLFVAGAVRDAWLAEQPAA
jgi:ornithine cyclodeaminase